MFKIQNSMEQQAFKTIYINNNLSNKHSKKYYSLNK